MWIGSRRRLKGDGGLGDVARGRTCPGCYGWHRLSSSPMRIRGRIRKSDECGESIKDACGGGDGKALFLGGKRNHGLARRI